MTQIMYEVYDALNSVGVDEDKATQGAKVLGEQHQPIGMLKRDCVEAIRELKAGFTARMAIVEADFAVRLRQQDDRIQFVLWMLGIVILMQVGVLGMLFRLLS